MTRRTFGIAALGSAARRPGLRLSLSARPHLPELKILLPGQPAAERGIEIECPEHAFGRLRKTKQVRRFFLIESRRPEWHSEPRWTREAGEIAYEMRFKAGVTLSARAAVEADGMRLTYVVRNETDLDFEEFQAPTCVQLYSGFYDLFLERTYVHHAGGFDLLASETPERLRMTRDQWLPCRYLAPFTMPVVAASRRVEQKEDGITWRHRLRQVNAPLLATLSRQGRWIAATHTFETPNVWSNPERTCHHADPGVPLPPRGTARLSLKVYIFEGSLEDLWTKITRARLAGQA